MARFSLEIAFGNTPAPSVAQFYEVRLKAAEAKIKEQELELQMLRSRVNTGTPRIRPIGGAQLPNFG
mgnify:FL=1